jgi:xylulokinase
MDYLNLRLTGRAAASCGSIWPYWLTDNRDVEAVAYDPTLVRWAGIDPEKLPELLPLDATVGTLTEDAAERLGLARRTSVLTGLSDAQAATVGAGIVALGQGYFSIGTTSWLSCLVPSKRTDLRHQLATKPSGLRGQRMAVAEQGPAGRCLEFLRERVLAGPGAEPPPFEELEREAAQAPPGSNGLVFTPWLAGVGAPADDALTRSAFLNQSLRSTRADYVRAVMEGVAYNLRWLRRHVERFARTRFEHLAMIGGGALSAVWSQTFADVLDCEVRQVAEPRYANAAGAALAGFAALGEIATGEIPAAVRTAASYRPDPVAARVHDRQFAHFLRFYERNRRLYRSLNR